jgi:hypothetical protein
MQAVNSIVLLYKSFGGEGFNLLSEEWTHTEEDLRFVHMQDVTFDILEDKKDPSRRTVHAVARGTLINALPRGLSPSKELMKKIEKLPEIDYRPNKADSVFFYVKDGREIYTAKTLYALDGKVRVEI